MAHAAAEIAVRRRDTPFACCQDSHIASQAGAAGRRRYGSTGFDERIDIPGMHGVLIDLLASGNDDTAHIGMYFMAFQYGSGDAQVFEASIGTRTDDDLIDFDITKGPDSFGIARQMRKGDDGLYLGQIDGDDTAVGCIGIGFVDRIGMGNPFRSTIDLM